MLAQELYGLELIHREQTLDDAQSERWQALAKQVFARERDEERRRSSRITGSGKAKVEIAGKTSIFDVLDVSWGGVRLEGKGANKLSDGAEAILIGVLVDKEWVDLNVGFSVVRRLGKGAAALRLTDLDPPRRQQFFEHAYYPMYLSHLKAIAEL